MTSASTNITGAAAVTHRMAQAISNNLLLPESAHGAALGGADAKAVECVFCMALQVCGTNLPELFQVHE